MIPENFSPQSLLRWSTDFEIPSFFSIYVRLISYDMIWYDMIWYDMIGYDMIWYDMGHPSASEFSQTQSPIDNALDGGPIHWEMLCHCSSTHVWKFLQKALKSLAKEIRGLPDHSSSPNAGKIVGFESPETILDGGQWNRIVLKFTHKFLANVFAPMSFEKEIFHHRSSFDSIYPNIHNVYIKCSSRKVLSARPDG
jgi:hypothetical protein